MQSYQFVYRNDSPEYYSIFSIKYFRLLFDLFNKIFSIIIRPFQIRTNLTDNSKSIELFRHVKGTSNLCFWQKLINIFLFQMKEQKSVFFFWKMLISNNRFVVVALTIPTVSNVRRQKSKILKKNSKFWFCQKTFCSLEPWITFSLLLLSLCKSLP